LYQQADGEPGHNIKVNDHPIFGYSRYINFYKEIVTTGQDDQIYVEVGSFLGQSTAAMAFFIMESQKRITFYAVDIFDISSFSDAPHKKIVDDHGGDLYKAFIYNMEKANVLSAVTPLKMTSLEASKTFEDRSISFLMIDASHYYQDVKDDINAWFPKVKIGGIISGDDFDWEDVSKAAKDALGRVETHGTTWYAIKVRETIEEQISIVTAQ